MTAITLRQQDYRTVWISDVHLGSKGCRAEFLYDFLTSIQCEELYLVGDIIDVWAMKRGVHWPQSHNEVLRAVLKKAKQGVKVHYVPGNHDELLRLHEGTTFGSVEIKNEAVHETIDGRKLLVIHGDEFDKLVTCGKLQQILGDYGYDFLLWLNRLTNRVRRYLGMPYWSLASFLKHKVKNAVRHIRRYEEVVAHEVKRRGFDGVVCGHVHHSEMRMIDGILYCNDGDWVESCTALVEHHDGTMQLLHWADEKHAIKDVEISLAPAVRDAA